jgi:hypothetical protein
MFCVESASRQATVHFETVFRQKVSVDTLEAIARRMNAEAEEYAEALPCPAIVKCRWRTRIRPVRRGGWSCGLA